MLKRLFVVALVATIPAFVLMPAAKADNTISSNQWYTAAFDCSADCYVAAPNLFGDGTDGEILPSGTESSIDVPAGTSWTIDGAGTLTLTDLEASGDSFEVYDNGAPMALAASPFAIPGQSGVISGGSSYTSTPNEGDFVGSDIDDALADSNFSSGTFALESGVNDISIYYLGGVGEGDMAFIAETSATPEPSSFVLLATGLMGIMFAFRKKLMA
jgi:hypothetical protein